MENEICVFERMDKCENEIKSIEKKLDIINRKLDEIIAGPIFNSTLMRIGTLEQICANNLKSLNNMMLQIKGVVSQVNTLRGRKSDWDGQEIQSKKLINNAVDII